VPVIAYIVTAVAAYLLGSIPTGFLVAKARGIDIRSVGSGNIGATNAFRILGKGPGFFVLLIDALKGWVAVCVAAPLIAGWIGGAPEEYLRITAGVTAVLGHNYTCWLGFKGGKGIATSAGVLIALVPWALLIILGVWILLFFTTRYVSVASIAASFTLPFATWFTTGQDIGLTAVTGAMGALAIYKHRKNIQRLIDGTESRIEFRKKEARP
jgi:glycerol-3-phosphate acyltransferase PlsY